MAWHIVHWLISFAFSADDRYNNEYYTSVSRHHSTTTYTIFSGQALAFDMDLTQCFHSSWHKIAVEEMIIININFRNQFPSQIFLPLEEFSSSLAFEPSLTCVHRQIAVKCLRYQLKTNFTLIWFRRIKVKICNFHSKALQIQCRGRLDISRMHQLVWMTSSVIEQP